MTQLKKDIENFVKCFPHLLISDEKDNSFVNQNVKRYDLHSTSIISLINSKYINDDIYDKAFNFFNKKKSFSQVDVVRFWLNTIISPNSKENIESLFKIIDLLDSSLYENHYQNLNLVFNDNSILNYDNCKVDFNYITNIDFTSNVYLEIGHDTFLLKEIYLDNKIQFEKDDYIPEKFKNYSYLFSLNEEKLSFTFHYMSNGDVFILSRNNINDLNFNTGFKLDLRKKETLTMIASRRNNNWYCYDNDIMEKLFISRFDNNIIGKNLLQLAFELSHKRKGALIVFDIKQNIKQKILNVDSSILSQHNIKFMKNLNNIIISSGKNMAIERNSFKILEVLMTMDGCVIFDNNGIVSTGSILSLEDSNISNKSLVFNNVTGARTAASIFSHELGGRVLKISQNGTISLFTTYYNQKIILEFL